MKLEAQKMNGMTEAGAKSRTNPSMRKAKKRQYNGF